MKDKYAIVRNKPVAKLYYKGSHSHPIRRTILVIENTKTYIRGYELREGNVVRIAATKAPIKTYSKSRIAKIGQCRQPVRKRIPTNLHSNTTFERKCLLDLVQTGI